MNKYLIISLFWLCCTTGAQGQTFTSQAIPDSVWQTMQGKTWHDNPYIRRSDLRYLRISHYDLEGRVHVGEMICNKLIADKLLAIFSELYAAHYPIQRMRLPDNYDADDERQMRDNNTSCFCYRNVSGSKNLSKHARGLAIDINTLYNPYIRYSKKDGSRIVEPATAVKYCDRKANFPYKITTSDLCYKLFTKYGFTWGGAWRTMKDYQHFEYKLR
jgi:hypothetical protein